MKMIPRGLLEEALYLYSEEKIQNLPAVPVVFSKKHEARMAKLFRRVEKPYFRYIDTAGKRVAAIILAVFIGLLSMVMSVKALREPFIRFIIETLEKYSIIKIVKPDERTVYPTSIEKKYLPRYVPEGYELIVNVDFYNHCYYTFTNGNKLDDITLSQVILMTHTLDTEDIEMTVLDIKGSEAVMAVSKECKTIIWNHYGYTFTLSGPEKFDFLVRMMESLEEKT